MNQSSIVEKSGSKSLIDSSCSKLVPLTIWDILLNATLRLLSNSIRNVTYYRLGQNFRQALKGCEFYVNGTTYCHTSLIFRHPRKIFGPERLPNLLNAQCEMKCIINQYYLYESIAPSTSLKLIYGPVFSYVIFLCSGKKIKEALSTTRREFLHPKELSSLHLKKYARERNIKHLQGGMC